MYTLETALLNQWREKPLSEKELLETGDLRKDIFRTAIAFGAYAVLLLCLSWAAEPKADHPQVASAAQMQQMPEARK